MTVPIVTAEYPREVWDEQRADFLTAVQQSRAQGRIVNAVIGVGVLCSGLLMSTGLNTVMAAVLLGVVVAMIAASVPMALRRKRHQRSVVGDLQEALIRSGHAVTADQAGILIGLGCCWLSDHRYLEAELSGADVVVLRVTDPPRENLASGMSGSAGGSGAGGGDGGGGC